MKNAIQHGLSVAEIPIGGQADPLGAVSLERSFDLVGRSVDGLWAGFECSITDYDGEHPREPERPDALG